MDKDAVKAPYLFDEFFASGMEESISPFLTKDSRRWGENLSLKSAAFASVCFLFAFGLSFLSLPLSYLFLTFVYFFSGAPALIAALGDLKNFEVNIDVLMTLAAFLAVLIGSPMEGALLLVLFELSHSMEESVSKKTKSALHNLNHLAPKFAQVVAEEGTVFEQAVRDIPLGALLLIKQGEIVPLDGHVVKGISSINLVHLTGEALPVPVQVGDAVAAGARNLDAALTIQVTRTNANSTLSRIIQLISAAQEAKPKLQRWLDRFGKIYASAIISLTFAFAVGLPFFLPLSYLGAEGAIYRALAFLIAASPCALILATPTAYLSALSACARKGILLKGGVTLDALASCQIIAFDKTGTLTTGELYCTSIETLGALSPKQALSIAAALERHVVHPIATAIEKKAEVEAFAIPELQNFKAIPGYGLEAFLDDQTPVAIGLPEHILSKLAPPLAASVRKWMETQKSAEQILSLLLVGETVALFTFSDEVRKEVPSLLDRLKKENQLRSVMLTGDRTTNAQFVGQQLGIDTILGDLRPEDKLEQVAKLAEQGGLAMVGDGINDAPALARATVGISMGRIGSATAIDASDVVLLNDDLHLLSWLFSKAHQTKRIVGQNLAVALGVICLATTPALLGWVPLWLAVLLHEGGTVLVGLNSLRLLRGRTSTLQQKSYP
jgi:Cd2+/Zn2+-exporting ATPase